MSYKTKSLYFIYIKTLEFKNYEDRVILKTRFWKKMGTFSIPFFGSKTYMELENGEKLKVKGFKQFKLLTTKMVAIS